MLIKMGREDQAIRVLITNCPSVTESVEFALALKVSDMNNLWDMMLANAGNDTQKLNELFQYVEQ